MKHLSCLRLALFSLLSMLLVACASPKLKLHAEHLLHDQLFSAPANAVSTEQVFALNSAMKEYLHGTIARQLRERGPQLGLFEALRNQASLKIEYDSAMTKNASQAFETRSGNCLSLVIMTSALAKELGLNVQYQEVMTQESWSRSGNFHFSSGHVNIVLGRRFSYWNAGYHTAESMIIDFLPPEDIRSQHARLIDEATILAMYLNNRAAELLASQQINEAYWFARAAIKQDPGFLNAYNTLGVIYLHHNMLAQAEQVFSEVLAREAKNTSAMHNLVNVLYKQGRQSEADQWHAKLEKLQPLPPFHFFNLGKAAMEKGDFVLAKTMFSKELERDPYYHEFHFWLALAHFRLGEFKPADEHLSLARDNSNSRQSHELYSAKLDRLKTYQVH